jgi:hypothetical protein
LDVRNLKSNNNTDWCDKEWVFIYFCSEFLENVQIGAAADGDGNLVAVSFSHLPEVPQDLAAFEATNGN